MTSTGLTIKQARFVDEYVVCGNAAAAARAAGYREKCARQVGFENLTKPYIQTAVQARRKAHATRLELSRQNVIQAILEAVQTAQEQGAPATMIRGWVEIAKITGLDKPESAETRRNVPLSAGAERVKARFEAMSTEELLEILAGKDRLLGE
jgi:phage terminase small subunit